MMMSLGRMATWLPLPRDIPKFCPRYVDEPMGFVVGWSNWYSSPITLFAEVSAVSTVIRYWQGAQDINIFAWIFMLIVLVLCLNILAVAIHGEAGFILASIQILTIVRLLIMAFAIDLGEGLDSDRCGFRYGKIPGAMEEYIATGSTGRSLGLFSTLVNAAFLYGGVEMVAVAAGEAENPHKNIP
jgi:yeast amino acid transporter